MSKNSGAFRLPTLAVAFGVAAAAIVSPVTAGAAAPTAKTAAPAVQPAPAADAPSYSLGLMIGSQWHDSGLTSAVSEAALMRGLHDSIGGKKPSEEDRKAATEFVRNAVAAFGEHNQQAAREFLAKNGKDPKVTTTASGLQYTVVVPGANPAPTASPSDRYTVQYRGRLLDGTEFDSSYAHGQPATLTPSGVIAGWREALGLMGKGAQWKLFVPPELAYGSKPPPAIPPNSLLVFEVEVLDIEPVNANAGVISKPAPAPAPAPK